MFRNLFTVAPLALLMVVGACSSPPQDLDLALDKPSAAGHYQVTLVPRFMSESEWLAYHDRRVKSYAQYPLSDDSTAGRGLARFHGFQSGIDSSSNRPKRYVYQAFQTPLFVRLVSRSSVEVFGGVRIASGGTALLQTAIGKRYSTLATVTLNQRACDGGDAHGCSRGWGRTSTTNGA